MSKQKPSLNQADISLLKKNFVTKKYLDKKLDGYPTKKYLDKKLDDYPTKKYLDKKLTNYPTKKDFDKRLTPIGKDLKEIKNSLNTIITFFDNEYLKLKARVERIENFLKIPPLSS